jgi:Mg2+ and Co2+ transporter CorA
MIELILIQRASVLRFSDEISHVGQLSKVKSMDKRLVERINSIYKEYIRFTNQIYFREVTTQDQGIELYNLLSETLNLQKHVEGLDKEIEELYQYVALVDDKIRNKNAEILNKIAAIFLPATVVAGLFGMNAIKAFGGEGEIVLCHFFLQLLFICFISYLVYYFLKRKNNF